MEKKKNKSMSNRTTLLSMEVCDLASMLKFVNTSFCLCKERSKILILFL